MGTAVLTPPPVKAPEDSTPPPGRGNDGSGGSGGRGDSGRGRGQPPNRSLPPGAYRIAIWIGVVSIAMLFAALTGAMIARAEFSRAWVRAEIPPILYLNTLLLLASSLTLELSRKSLRREIWNKFKGWLYATTALGVLFIGGQLDAWRQLAARGLYMSTNPSSSFFYLLTAAHGVHLLGGILALAYLILRSRKIFFLPQRRVALDVAAIYWHFMDALWIYLLILLKIKL